MIENKNRLDIRKCSDEGVNRLVTAILINTVRDWNGYAKSVNKNGYNDSDIYELKQIINFIQSDYFISLTNGNSPQKECVDKLIKKITDKKSKEEISKYAKLNEEKWKGIIKKKLNSK